MRMTLGDWANACGGTIVHGQPRQAISRVATDTRTLRAGDWFVALKGPRFDAHDFLGEAAERGASGVVLEDLSKARFRDGRTPAVLKVSGALSALQSLARLSRERSRACVIGVTGSNGKTTTKQMLASILERCGPTLSTRGNLNNHIGLPLMLCELSPEHRFAVLELGTSRPGDMDLLVDLARPRIGVLSNVGKDHLEFVGTPDGMLAVNRPLIDRLPADGIAVLNLDDPRVASLAVGRKGRTITFGFTEKADVAAFEIKPWPLPLSFTLRIPGGSAPVALQLPGRIQVMNALAAATAAVAAGATLESIVAGLAAFKPPPMRFQILEEPGGAVLVNDAYNANPSSMRAAIEAFVESFPERTRWLVLGDMREMGAAARDEHEELGRWLRSVPVSRVFCYGRDMRFLERTISGASSGVVVERFKKKRYLVEHLRACLAGEKPAILFKGSRVMKLEDVVAALR